MSRRLNSAHIITALLLVVIVAIPEYAVAQLEEIVVTTRKKAESLQEIPIAVDAISVEQIERQGIVGIADVAKLNSSMQFGTGFGPQDTRIALRGLSNTRGRSNVAILVDGIDVTTENFISPGSGLLANQRLLNDVERIEVIKGPQSALYGRSAFAGAVSYITKEPGEAPEGRVRVDGAEDGFLQVDGSFSGPLPGIEDILGMRISGVYWTEDGHYTNSVSGDQVGGGDGYGASWTTVFTPTDAIRIKTRLEYSDDEYDPLPTIRFGGGLSGGNLELVEYPDEGITPFCVTYPDHEACALENGVPVNPELHMPPLGGGSPLFTGLVDFVQFCPELNPWFDGETSGDENGDGLFDDDILRDPDIYGIDENGVVQGTGYCLPKTFGEVGDQAPVSQSEDPETGNDWDGFDTELFRATISATFDLGWGSFSSYTGWTDFESNDEYDQDAQAMGRPDLLRTDFHSEGFTDTEQFSQELRFASSFDGPVNFTVGANYWEEERSLQDQNYIISCIEVGKNNNAPWGDPARIAMDISSICDGTQGTVGPDDPWQTYWQDLRPCLYDGTKNDDEFFVPVMDPATGGCVQTGSTPIPWKANTEHWSLYVALDWAITEAFTVTFENRYVDEDFDVSRPNQTACGEIGAPFGTVPFIQLFAEGTVNDARDDVVCLGEEVLNPYIPVSPDNPFSLIEGSESSSFNTPKVTLDWAATDDALLYFSWAHAQKPGGINATAAGNSPTTIENERFEPEKMDAWEIGAKTAWDAGGYLQLNGALFLNDYTDKQIGSQVLREGPDGALNLNPQVINAAAAEVWGLEMEAVWQPSLVEGLVLNASYTYLDAEYTDFVDDTRSLQRGAKAGNCSLVYIDENDDVVPPTAPEEDILNAEPFCRVNLSGHKLEGSPEHSFVGNLQLTRPFMDQGFDWFLELTAAYQDERFFTQDNFITLDDYWLVDARLGLTSESWEFLIYVDNLFDDETIKTGARGPDFGDQVTKLGFTAGLGVTNWFGPLPDPQIFGARLTVRF